MIAGDLVVDQLRDTYNTQSKDQSLIRTDGKSTQCSFATAFSTIMALSIASDPFLMAGRMQAGIVNVFIIALFALAFNLIGYFIYVRSWHYGSDPSFQTLFAETISKKYAWIPNLFVLITFASIATMECDQFTAGYKELIQTYWKSAPTVLTNEWFYNYGIPLVLMIPVLFFDKITDALVYSILSNVCITLSMVCMIIIAVSQLIDHGWDPMNVAVYFHWDAKEILDVFAYYNLAQFIQPFVPLVLTDMERPTRSRVYKIGWGTYSLNLIINYLFAIGGYSILYTATEDARFLDYLPANNVLIIISKICATLLGLTSSTLYTYCLCVEFCRSLYKGSEKNRSTRFFSGLVWILFSCVFSFASDRLLVLADLFGQSSFILVSFIIPPIIYLKMNGFKKDVWGILSVIMVVISIPLAIILTVLQVV